VTLEEENYRLQETVQTCLDEVTARKDKPEGQSHTLKKQPSLKWAPFKPSRSPTKAEHESPASSPQAMEHHIPVSTLFWFIY
jgi:bZIP factor